MRCSTCAALLVLPAVTAGCGGAPGEPMQRHYNTTLPADVNVVRFHGDAFKDPQFYWELSPIREPFLQRLVNNAQLTRFDPETQAPPSSPLPPVSWWPGERLDGLDEVYFRDAVGESSLYRVYVDREGDRLFVLFVNN